MERTANRNRRFRSGLIIGAAMAACLALPAGAAGSGGKLTLKTCYDAGASTVVASIVWRQPYFVSEVDVELLDANGKLLAIDAQTDTPSLVGSTTLYPAISAETLASVATVVVDLGGKGGETQLVRQAPHNGFKAC